ncbi:hypothetical protein [Hyalangium sp.]|uniref:hypothetical protein n=1 Tax=Hyalangium sp. TaxID=2028555 RepID=UPI002D2801B7|nr:hypothetical protein [Hyalangium sp.]HYH95082.1 hypothetical protein [Hyalangium sp.]
MPSSSSSIGTPLAVEVEIRREKASALRRVGDKLETLIAQLVKLQGELSTLSGWQRAKKAEEYQKLWADADYQRWCLVIQRESLGLFHHAEVDLMYPIPPKVK